MQLMPATAADGRIDPLTRLRTFAAACATLSSARQIQRKRKLRCGPKQAPAPVDK